MKEEVSSSHNQSRTMNDKKKQMTTMMMMKKKKKRKKVEKRRDGPIVWVQHSKKGPPAQAFLLEHLPGQKDVKIMWESTREVTRCPEAHIITMAEAHDDDDGRRRTRYHKNNTSNNTTTTTTTTSPTSKNNKSTTNKKRKVERPQQKHDEDEQAKRKKLFIQSKRRIQFYNKREDDDGEEEEKKVSSSLSTTASTSSSSSSSSFSTPGKEKEDSKDADDASLLSSFNYSSTVERNRDEGSMNQVVISSDHHDHRCDRNDTEHGEDLTLSSSLRNIQKLESPVPYWLHHPVSTRQTFHPETPALTSTNPPKEEGIDQGTASTTSQRSRPPPPRPQQQQQQQQQLTDAVFDAHVDTFFRNNPVLEKQVHGAMVAIEFLVHGLVAKYPCANTAESIAALRLRVLRHKFPYGDLATSSSPSPPL